MSSDQIVQAVFDTVMREHAKSTNIGYISSESLVLSCAIEEHLKPLLEAAEYLAACAASIDESILDNDSDQCVKNLVDVRDLREAHERYMSARKALIEGVKL